jgi:nitrite reductase/ring-hydroxylating ferredoxin subunit
MSRTRGQHTELPIPNGWFAMAYSRDLVPGEVKPLHYFGEDLVLFRTREGRACVLDAYCAHLGAHLGVGGRVVGESVRCPFHGWQFDGATGQCSGIPYCDRIPPRARVRAWDVCEKNGMVFAWHHAEGKPPAWDFPELPELSDPEWTEPRVFELELPVHVQDSHENNNDPMHFQFVHKAVGMPNAQIHFGDDGRFMRVEYTADRETPWGTMPITLANDSWGIGLVAVRTLALPEMGVLMYSSTTPIESNRSHSRWLLTTTRNLADLAGDEFLEGLMRGVRDDVPIWRSKIHRADPVLCEADGFLAAYRKWVRQFYSQPVEGKD